MAQLTAEEQLLLASSVGARAHHNHFRKDGTPYFSHPVRVAIRAAASLTGILDPGESLDLEIQTVALLHDTVEDTPVTFEELRELGFSPTVIAAVDSVTKRVGEPYSGLIERAKANVIGRAVKIADIQDNLADQSALDPEEVEFFRNRYTKALEVLNG